jgi:hypothetical protein
MMFVFGTHPTTISRFTHQHEGDSGPTEYTVMGRYFHFMFLALFPTKKFVVVKEPGGKEYGIDPNEPGFQQLATSKGAKTGFGLRPWWGWLVIGGLFLAYKGMDYYFSRSHYTGDYSALESSSDELSKDMENLKTTMADGGDEPIDTTGTAASIQASTDRAIQRVGTLKKDEMLAVMFPSNELPFVLYLVTEKKGDKYTLLESAYGWDDYSVVADAAESREYKEDKEYWEKKKVTLTKADLIQMAKSSGKDYDREKGILMAVLPEEGE